MALTLVRHTRPDIEDGVCYGKLDLPLANTFREEASVVLEQLPRAKFIVSSPLSRCVQLANWIGDALQQGVSIDERLREMDFGAWEGIRWNDIPRSELDKWNEDFYHARPHGGESVAMLTERVQSAISEFRETGNDHIVVCHAGVIKAALSEGKTSEDYSAQVPFGGIVKLYRHPNLQP